MKRNLTVLATIAVIAFATAASLSIHTANAYSIETPAGSNSGASSGSGGLNDLLSPFGNFINNLNSIGNHAVPLPPVGVLPILRTPVQGTGTSLIKDLLQRLDSTIYGVAKFHITDALIIILNTFSWILGAMKGATDWLVGLFR